MLNLLKTVKKNENKIEKIVLSQPKKGNDRNITRHFPANTKSWYNSIYTFDKNMIKSVSVLDKIVNNLLRMYFNLKLNVNLDKGFKRRRTKMRRLSSTKIFISKAEMKHSNDKLIINLYTYNRNKKKYIKKIKKLYRKIFSYIPILKIKDKKYLEVLRKNYFKSGKYLSNVRIKNKNLRNKKFEFYKKSLYKRYARLFLFKYFFNSPKVITINNYDKMIHQKYTKISKKGSIIFNKFLYRSKNLLKLLKAKNLNSILGIVKKNRLPFYFKQKNLETYDKYNKYYYNRFIKNTLKKEMMYLNYNQLLNTDANKFNNIYLSRLGKLISGIYNKNIEFNIINLKYMFLDSHIFSESILLKLRNRNNNLVRVLKSSISLQKLNLFKRYSYKTQNLYLNRYNMSNKYGFGWNDSKIDVLDYLLNQIFNLKKMYTTQKLGLYKKLYIYRSIKFRKIRGVRLEARGRLTRRLTASRAVFKLRYKGSLSNLDSSNKLSSTMIRNHLKSNLDYVNLNSKTRNGSFGLKGWISSK